MATIKSTLIDLEKYLKDEYKLRRNCITRLIENDGNPMTSEMFNSIFIAANKKFGKISADIIDRLIHSSFTQTYNPLVEFFDKYKSKKPKGAIDNLFDTITSDDYKYSREFGKKWLVSIIASIYGKHSRIMLVLSGREQNTGKTEWFRRLLPADLHNPHRPYPDYYAESKLDAGKDDEILMTQKIIIMDDEMGGKSKKDEKRLKELLSRQTFSLREPYGHNNIDLIRLAVLCGTTNEEILLNDPTGNSRLVPICVYGINQHDYNQIDKTDVFMEAYHLYHAGYSHTLNQADVITLNSNSEKFNSYSAEYELIGKYFRPSIGKNDFAEEELSATDIKNFLETVTLQKLTLDRVGKELSRLGFKREIKKIDGKTKRIWYVVKLIQTATSSSMYTQSLISKQ